MVVKISEKCNACEQVCLWLYQWRTELPLCIFVSFYFGTRLLFQHCFICCFVVCWRFGLRNIVCIWRDKATCTRTPSRVSRTFGLHSIIMRSHWFLILLLMVTKCWRLNIQYSLNIFFDAQCLQWRMNPSLRRFCEESKLQSMDKSAMKLLQPVSQSRNRIFGWVI